MVQAVDFLSENLLFATRLSAASTQWRAAADKLEIDRSTVARQLKMVQQVLTEENLRRQNEIF